MKLQLWFRQALFHVPMNHPYQQRTPLMGGHCGLIERQNGLFLAPASNVLSHQTGISSTRLAAISAAEAPSDGTYQGLVTFVGWQVSRYRKSSRLTCLRCDSQLVSSVHLNAGPEPFSGNARCLHSARYSGQDTGICAGPIGSILEMDADTIWLAAPCNSQISHTLCDELCKCT